MAAQPTWILNSDDSVSLEMATLSQSLRDRLYTPLCATCLGPSHFTLSCCLPRKSPSGVIKPWHLMTGTLGLPTFTVQFLGSGDYKLVQCAGML